MKLKCLIYLFFTCFFNVVLGQVSEVIEFESANPFSMSDVISKVYKDGEIIYNKVVSKDELLTYFEISSPSSPIIHNSESRKFSRARDKRV